MNAEVLCDHTCEANTLFRQMDMGSFTCAHIWMRACRIHEGEGEGGAINKRVCIKVDSVGQKNRQSPCPARGSNSGGSSDLNSDGLPLSYVPLTTDSSVLKL